MERRILQGLVLEWECAACRLTPKRRRGLQLPCFEIRDLRSAWGVWIGDRKTIVLSRRLVEGYGWLSIREVLLHEMAHQYADECLGGDLAPHGERFREACRLLGADPAASNVVPSVYQRADGTGDPAGDRIMSRVGKLLALAHSNSRHEAELAMSKVHEHMARYNISVIESGYATGLLSMGIGEPVLRFSADKYAMMELLRDYYFVSTVLVQAYVVDGGRMGRVIEAGGRLENLKMAGYVYAFLNRSIDEQWKLFRRTGAAGRRCRIDFALGLIRGFRDRLESQKRAFEGANARANALAVKGDAELDRYVRARFPHLRSVRRGARRVDGNAMAAGIEAGRRTVLSKPVEAGKCDRGLLLER